MKNKHIKITAIIVLILFLLIYGRILIKYKPSRLICVGQIKINHDARPSFGFERLFGYFNKDDLERELNGLSEMDYFILNQQEIDEVVDAVYQYENYPTVILSRVKSGVFWTRYRSPHIGYMNIHHIRLDRWLKSDDVLYVYVTKCTEIDNEPWDWQWRSDLW